MKIIKGSITKALGNTYEKEKARLLRNKEKIYEATSEYGAGLISTGIQNWVDDIRENAREKINEAREQLTPEAKNSWEIIRSNIAPNGGFFKTIFAGLVWFGAKVSAFAGAAFIDNWTGKDEKDQNQGNIELIVASQLSNLFKDGSIDKSEEQSSRKPMNFDFLLPKALVSNTI